MASSPEKREVEEQTSDDSFLSRTMRTVKIFLGWYNPQLWASLYLPLFYVTQVNKRATEASTPDEPLRKEQSIATAVFLCLFCYNFALSYGFLDWLIIIWPFTGTEMPEHKGHPSLLPDELGNTDIDQGLTEDEAESRLKSFGLHQYVKRYSWSWVAMHFVFGHQNLLLKATAVLALCFQHWVVASLAAILVAYHWYIMIGMIKDYFEVVDGIGFDTTVSQTTRRDGKMKQITASQLIPGDIIFAKAGEAITADCRVVKPSGTLSVNQTSITGQDTSIRKLEGDECLAGTTVVSGEATLLVTGTGRQTFIGRTLSLIQDPMASKKGGLRNPPYNVRDQKALLRTCGGFFSCLAGLALALTWSTADRNEWLNLALALGILVNMDSVGVHLASTEVNGLARLSEYRAVCQRQMGAESPAGIDVLCVDKTGTLTKNDLEAKETFVLSGSVDDFVMVTCIAGCLIPRLADPIDRACLSLLDSHPESIARLEECKVYEEGSDVRIDFTEFDVVSKRITGVAVLPDGTRMECTKGAPKAILAMSKASKDVAEKFKTEAGELARRGLRSLGVARKLGSDGEWELLGLLALGDPVRNDAALAIRRARELGVDVKMMTGDATAIAKAFSREVGFGTNIVNGNVSLDEEKKSFILRADGYSEVFPEHKQTIIEILRTHGHIVACTGDGINDSYALQKADCGIAAGGSSEAAQCASDIVMLAPGIASMILAIEISRQTMHIAWSYVAYRITLNLHLGIAVVAEFVVHHTIPDMRPILLAIHFSDIIGLFLSDEVKNAAIPTKPVRWSSRTILLCVVMALPINGFSTLVTNVRSNADSMVGWRQAIFLQAVLADHWPFVFELVQNGLRCQLSGWRSRCVVVLFGVIATLACILGILGDEKMSIQLAAKLWMSSVIAAAEALILRLLIAQVTGDKLVQAGVE